MIIEKKAWPEMFEKILSGEKKFDFRLADFDVNEGDILLLKEWDPETKNHTGREIRKKINYVLKTKETRFWPQEEIDEHGLVLMGFE